MRSRPGGLNHAADGAGCDQLTGLFNGPAFETLGKADREDPASFDLDLSHRRQLIQRDDAWLVDDHVISVAHLLDRSSCALVGDGGTDNQINAGVLQDGALLGHPAHLGDSALVIRSKFVFQCEQADQCRARVE